MSETRQTREIERKFLVAPDALPFPLEAQAQPASVIRQGYLVVNASDKREARLRDRDGKYTLTVKTGTGVTRGEGEINLSQQQFDALWPFTDGRRINKHRHDIDLGTLTAELDIYAGAHQGLAVVEVEFPDEASAEAFEPPDWFGAEVTGDTAYSNQSLALHPEPGR